jgi:hypothetical protein
MMVACGLVAAALFTVAAAHGDTRVRLSRPQVRAPWTEQCTGTDACLPTPTPSQARYQDTDFVALICYNMCTYAHNGDPGCDESNWDVIAPYASGPSNDPSTFKPTALNTSQWMESVVGLGASIAVLTAKHGCGFLLWPTKSTLPDGSPFNYNTKTDILGEFVDAAKAHGVGYGFYYSIMKSFYLCHSFTGELPVYQGGSTCRMASGPHLKEGGALRPQAPTPAWARSYLASTT